MAEERVFLSEGNVYVTNARIVIDGTTYSTANVTSVRKTMTPANRGCALIVIIFGVLAAMSGVALLFGRTSDDAMSSLVMAAVLLLIGIPWFRSMKPIYRVMLASASGERQGLTSPDESLVDRATIAIADAIAYRG
ncbi:MAG TPA: DUF6232 family protein [Thermoanaerobaculia bacterium]|nr:DUF6232 family protein [Thermoanaerobaculia bacterium]